MVQCRPGPFVADDDMPAPEGTTAETDTGAKTLVFEPSVGAVEFPSKNWLEAYVDSRHSIQPRISPLRNQIFQLSHEWTIMGQSEPLPIPPNQSPLTGQAATNFRCPRHGPRDETNGSYHCLASKQAARDILPTR